ncbi:MAG: efflux RND transporter periplasmic adaptor subunit [Alphaproteobacteria bacterium]
MQLSRSDWLRVSRPIAAVAISVLALGVLYYVFSGSAPEGGPGGPGGGGGRPPPSVLVGKAQTGKVVHEIVAVGSLRSNESVVIQPEITGRIVEISFNEGEAIAKGATLIRLDDSVHQAELQQAQAQLALSKANYDRASDLFKRGNASARARDEALAQMRVAEANVALASALLEKTNITAPFDGTLGLREVSVGDYVKPGDKMVNIENIDPVKVDFRIPEVHAAVLKVGQDISVALDPLPGQHFQGAVYAIDPLIDPNGRAVILRARVENKQEQLRPGMFARVNLVLDRRDDAIMLPETAVFPMGVKRFVYRVVDGKAVRAEVETGMRREGKVEIVSGITLEDIIVLEGHFKLQDGRPLTPISAEKDKTS